MIIEILLSFFVVPLAQAETLSETQPLKSHRWNIFPVPIFKTLPSEGETYGLMPVVTLSNATNELKAILALAETYNQVTGFSTFGTIYYYPQEGSVYNIFVEAAQRFARELTLQFSIRPKKKGELIQGGKFGFLRYPFERFFGFGPSTPKSNETNFVSQSLTAHGELGYYFQDTLSLTHKIRLDSWKLLPRALENVADTRTSFAGNNEVVDSTNITHRLEFQYDTHPETVFSKWGESFTLAYLASLRSLGSDHTFHGYDLRGKITRGTKNGRFLTVIAGKFDQRFGATIPFYLQSSLGGLETLRAFIERRFTGRHRLSFDLEERIEILRREILDTEVGLSFDPFVSVGQVFNRFSEINFDNLQPAVGFGIRAKAKPSVVGRVDFGYGGEEIAIHATLDYPF